MASPKHNDDPVDDPEAMGHDAGSDSDSGGGGGGEEKKEKKKGKKAHKSSANLEYKAQREHKRLEANRIRARERRKRDKVMWRQMQQKIVLLSQENNELKGRIMMLEGELARAYHRHAGMPAPAGGGGGPMPRDMMAFQGMGMPGNMMSAMHGAMGMGGMGAGGMMMPGPMAMQGLPDEQQAQMRMRHQQAMMAGGGAGGRPGMMGFGAYGPPGDTGAKMTTMGRAGPSVAAYGPDGAVADSRSPHQGSTGQAPRQKGAPEPGSTATEEAKSV